MTPPRAVQWRMLGVTVFCYLFYYTGRQNFGWAVKGISDELDLSLPQIGWLSAAMLISYGVGQAIFGNLGDKFGARKLMTIGALLSCALNWVTSLGDSFRSLLVPWMANGLAQSMGWAPGSRLLSNWSERTARGRVFGLYVFAAGFSSALTYGLSILVLTYLSWRWLFRLPVLLLLVGAIIFYVFARDRPEDLGYEPFNDEPSEQEEHRDKPRESSWERYRYVLSNRRFLLACLAIGFESWARYGLLVWMPVHYLGQGLKEDPQYVWVALSLPIGMAFGAMTVGQLSDRLFQSNRSRPIALFLAAAAVVTLAMYFVPTESPALGIVLLFLAGFFVYGPQSAFWALCPDLLGRQRAGTGVGIMDAAAYGLAACGEPIIGYVIDTTGQTSTVFLITSLVSALGAVCILFVRR